MRVHVEEEDSAEKVERFTDSCSRMQQVLEIRIRGFLMGWRIAATCAISLAVTTQ